MIIAFVLLLLVAAMVLFATEKLPVDIVTFLMLLALLFTGILTPKEAFAGFGSDIILILGSVFVISGAMRETGVVDWVGETLSRLARQGKSAFLTLMMASVSGLSAFMNNTTVTALMLTPVIGMARKRKISASKLLMPMAFASILGGTCTLIGTSTNVAVSGFLAQTGERPIGFFELTPIGLIIVAVGILYMWLVGQRMLPNHAKVQQLTEDYGLREYLSEILIRENSRLIGQALSHSDLGKMDFRVLRIHRDDKSLAPHPRLKLAAGDLLLVNGPVESLMKVRETEGVEIKGDFKFGDKALTSDQQGILELIVTPQSSMRGRRLMDLDLPVRHGIVILAINRHGEHLREKIKSVPLETGDLLLVQGAVESLEALRQSSDFALFNELNPATHRGKKGLLVMAYLLAGVAISALGWVPLSAGLLAAAVATVLTHALPLHRVYQVVEWRLLVLIAGMTAFGVAMEKSGAAEWAANGIVFFLEPMGTYFVLAGFALLTVALTQPMSNAAAALVVLPIALATAEKLGVNARAFAMVITYAASVSLIAPFEPSSLLVYGPGKYRFLDFMKVGGVLTLILLAVILVLVPVFWPL